MSYQALEKSLAFGKALPVSEHWSAAADFLTLVSSYCLEHRPKSIVECSSGTSSLVLSQCCQLNQYGHVYSLENGKEFVEKTRQQLEAFSLSDYCDVIYAPLSKVHLGDEDYQWYQLNEFPQVEIDLLVIDGPPGFLQKNSRYPALPLLNSFLAQHCVVFMDDAGRADEQLIVKRWLQENPAFQFEYMENDRGCSILKR